MSDTTLRQDGIYTQIGARHASQNRVHCILCRKEMSGTALTKAAHGKKHVRNGEAVARLTYNGDGPKTVYEPTPSDA